jgi:hypothetical protein
MRNWLSWLKSVNALNIERAYKHCDDAVGKLRSYHENPSTIDKALLDEIVAEAIADAKLILDLKGQKAWDGAFREMHEYLAKIHMERREFEPAREHANGVREYDRNEGDYLLKQIDAYQKGETIGDFDHSKAESEKASES